MDRSGISGQAYGEDFLIGEQRRWPRVDTTFTAMFADGDGYFREEQVVNVSKGGLFLKTRRPLAKNHRVEMILMLPDQSAEIAVQGQVIHSKQLPDQDDFAGMGIMFTTVEPNLKHSLGHFIDRLFDANGGGEREHPRVAVPSQKIVLSGAGGESTALLCNLSQDGMYIRTQNSLSLFGKVTTYLTNPETYLRFEIPGEVVHLQKVSDIAPCFGAGIRFTDLDPSAKNAVIEMVREIMFRQKIRDPLNVH